MLKDYKEEDKRLSQVSFVFLLHVPVSIVIYALVYCSTYSLYSFT